MWDINWAASIKKTKMWHSIFIMDGSVLKSFNKKDA